MAAPDLFPAGVHVAAFRRADSAILAVWSDQEMEIPVTLNDGAKLFPPTGAIRRMRTGERLKIGPLPQFLVGIDPMLLEMRLHLSGPDLPLQLNPTTRTLRLRNPLRTQPLRDVRVKVVEMPPGWRVSPLAIGAPALGLAPGAAEKAIGAAEKAMKLAFPPDFRASLRQHDTQHEATEEKA